MAFVIEHSGAHITGIMILPHLMVRFIVCITSFLTLDFIVYSAIFSARKILMFHASQHYCAHIDCIIVRIDSFRNVCAALQLCISVHFEKTHHLF